MQCTITRPKLLGKIVPKKENSEGNEMNQLPIQSQFTYGTIQKSSQHKSSSVERHTAHGTVHYMSAN